MSSLKKNKQKCFGNYHQHCIFESFSPVLNFNNQTQSIEFNKFKLKNL
jgi:hypothetical protein